MSTSILSSTNEVNSLVYQIPEKIELNTLNDLSFLKDAKTLTFQDDSLQQIHIYQDESIESIIESIVPQHDDDDTPFFLMDLSTVVEKFVQWMKLMPRVEPHYAVKCNSDPLLLKVLSCLGVKFDCASQGEIQSVLKFPQVSGNDIIFANPCKPKAHILCAKRNNVKQMTFDNLQELEKN